MAAVPWCAVLLAEDVRHPPAPASSGMCIVCSRNGVPQRYVWWLTSWIELVVLTQWLYHLHGLLIPSLSACLPEKANHSPAQPAQRRVLGAAAKRLHGPCSPSRF